MAGFYEVVHSRVNQEPRRRCSPFVRGSSPPCPSHVTAILASWQGEDAEPVDRDR